ncbi:MAG TPA: hypothetical protein V6C84_21465 [Coleofasciculaceae cyanobacterium]|jgi:hypothetical protein
MKIPVDAEIPEEKLTRYLLLPRMRDDKSKFLAQGGFELEASDALRAAIIHLIKTQEAVEDGINEYGIFYRVVGNLEGVNGRSLLVVVIWIRWYSDSSFHFVTLKPQKGALS